MNLTRAFETALVAAREAGEILREDFHLRKGPRGSGDKAEADTEAERQIRARLLAERAGWGYLGEELGPLQGSPGEPVWLVDPNDGTRDYLEGRRGSAVSIGLVSGGVPILGVVYAFGYPDDEGDLFCWCEGGGPPTRNGEEVLALLPDRLTDSDTVLVSTSLDADAEGNLRSVAPARFRTVPSIAHRLGLLASGEGAGVSSLYAPTAWDFGGGHALLRGAGGKLRDQDGKEVAYSADGSSRVLRAFAGSAALSSDLGRRIWRTPTGGVRPRAWVAPGAATRDPGLLRRGQGGLLGLIASESPLADAPGRLAGQPDAEGERALFLARSILRGVSPAEAARTASEILGKPTGLAHAAPLGIAAHAEGVQALTTLARTLPAPEGAGGADAVTAFVVGLGRLVGGDSARGALSCAWDLARTEAFHPDVQRALQDIGTPGEGRSPAGLLQRAFSLLLGADSFESVVSEGAEAGALLGARLGRAGIPKERRLAILSCHPHPSRIPNPRPMDVWPAATLELAEGLLGAFPRKML